MNRIYFIIDGKVTISMKIFDKKLKKRLEKEGNII